MGKMNTKKTQEASWENNNRPILRPSKIVKKVQVRLKGIWLCVDSREKLCSLLIQAAVRPNKIMHSVNTTCIPVSNTVAAKNSSTDDVLTSGRTTDKKFQYGVFK